MGELRGLTWRGELKAGRDGGASAMLARYKEDLTVGFRLISSFVYVLSFSAEFYHLQSLLRLCILIIISGLSLLILVPLLASFCLLWDYRKKRE